MAPESNCDISVVIIAHREGRLVHRTVRSAERACARAQSQGLRTELVAVLDRPDSETAAYFATRADAFATVQHVDLGDPGLARNEGVRAARGRYVAFLDGDDLFTEEWLAAAHAFVARFPGQTLVLHPELSVTFGARWGMYVHKDSLHSKAAHLDLLCYNHWSALSFVERAFLLRCPMASSERERGFGHEDWHWNCESLSLGAVHRVVPRTAHFIRRKHHGSRNIAADAAGHVIKPSALFDEVLSSKGVGTPSPSARVSFSTLAHGFLRRVYRAARLHLRSPHRWVRFVWGLLLPLAELLRLRRPPTWLQEVSASLADIEPELSGFPRRLPVSTTPPSAVARRFPALIAAFGDAGADVHIIPAVSAEDTRPLANAGAGNSRACLLVEGDGGRLVDQLQGARVVPFGRFCGSADESERAYLLLRLFLQKPPRFVHCRGAPLGLRLFADYGLPLSQFSTLYLTVLPENLDEKGLLPSHLLVALEKCLPHVRRIYLPTEQCVDQLRSVYWLPRAQACSEASSTGLFVDQQAVVPASFHQGRAAWLNLPHRRSAAAGERRVLT